MSKVFTLGWEEWVALPDLNLPALKAKVDTGARTSALHAFRIEIYGPAEHPMVHFGIHPIPSRDDVAVFASAPICDRREVTSSNGETELRPVVRTTLRIGERSWPIEVSLTNREAMSYRMLLGRQAISEDTLVDPSLSFRQPALDYAVYDGAGADHWRRRRPLRIALLSREPDNYSGRRLREAAEARGHVVEALDTARCVLSIVAGAPTIEIGGRPIPQYDAVIPRIGPSMTHFGLAVLRQLEMMGCHCLNRADGIGISRDKLLAHQTLARNNLPTPTTAFAYSAKDTRELIRLAGGPPVVLKLLASAQGRGVVLAETQTSAESMISALRRLDANFLVQDFIEEANGADVRCLVVGGRVLGAMLRVAAKGDFRANLHSGGAAQPVRLDKQERRLASRAARVMGLDVAGVDLMRTAEGPKVLEVNSSPGLEGIEGVTGRDLAGPIIDHLADHASALVHVVRPPAPVGRVGALPDDAGHTAL